MKKNTVSIYQLFPFEKVCRGEEIILYGFGKIGKRYLAQIEETGYCKVKYIVDQRASEYRNFRIPVHTVDFLKQDENALIVVTVYSETERREIIKTLLDRGIHRTQIITGDHRVAVEEGCTGGSDLFQISCYTAEEAKACFDSGFWSFWAELNRQLKIKRISEKPLARIGKEDDGGYIMIDDFRSSGTAYSFGISDDVSWDMDMADRGYEIFMYDHTIHKLPFEHERFHFFKKGIADSEDTSQELNSLERYLEENGHSEHDGMILKMDVEGAERGFFHLVRQDTLRRFDQIVFELHGLLSREYYTAILSALKKINETHELFHVHGNNHGNVIWIDQIPFPELLELSFVRKDLYKTRETENITLPLDIDRPCLKEFPDIALGNWNRRGKEDSVQWD